MARKKDSKFGAILAGPAIVCVGVLALWENEGRFDFHKAARQATVVADPAEASQHDTFALTGQLETKMPIQGYYVEGFTGYYRVDRNAEIYCWDRDEDSDGDVTWREKWMSSVDNNSRNSGIKKTLKSDHLFPPRYELGDLLISAEDIHLVDDREPIAAGRLAMTDAAKSARLRIDTQCFYKGKGRLSSPELGDERIEYYGIPNSPTASYFGAVRGDMAWGKQYEVSQSFLSGIIQNDGMLHHLANGDREVALATIKGYLAKLLWFTRLGGTVAIIVGMLITVSPFVGLLRGVPVLGPLVEWGAFLISVVLGLTLAGTVIAASYIAHHPLLVALPLVLVGVGIYYLRRRSQATKENVQTALSEYQQKHAASADEEGFDIDINSRGWSAGFAEQTFEKLVAMASLHGLGRKETKFLEQWGESNGIAKSRVDQMIATAPQEVDAVEIDTRNDMILLVCVALADGMLSGREHSALKSIAKRVDMEPAVLNEIIAGVEAGTLRPA
ncbi:TMEM43 family protein [Aeoliella mucimassa]|uniref:Uncharacterized protein n=1 Tax=Aeoliella mucimassa TaxID=2527972 RepID=A0A518AP20_9BACT|nr:TMEM43 family protein [Aeoliella mucimassa]QDU56441.1 hypothetical protein Pan181_26500 [Aeoliella mucimassa]